MNKREYFLKNTFILLLGKISTQFLSFLLLPLYTSYLTTAEYGLADLISTYVVFLAPIFCLQIENAGFRFLINARGDEEKTGVIIKNITSFVLKILVFLATVMLILNYFIHIPYFEYIFAYSLLYELYSLNQQFARGKGDNTEYAISSCIYGALIIVCNLLFIIRYGMGIEGLLLSYIIASLISLLYLLIKNNIIDILLNTKTDDSDVIKSGLEYSIPLIPSSISWWILNLSDRTIISSIISTAANGIYSISNKFSSVFIGFFNIINLSWTETVSLHIDLKDNFLEKLYNNLVKFFMMILTLIICVIPIIYPYLISENFMESYKYVPILLTASLFNVLFGLTQAIYIGLKKTKSLAKANLICAIINIVINLALIKVIGIYAAALSTLVAYFLLFIYQYIDINKYYKIKLVIKDKIILILLYSLGVCIYLLNYKWVSLSYTVIVVVLLTILYKNEMLLVIKKIKLKKK